MTQPIEVHAARFDAKADAYDERDRPVYRACLNLVIAETAPTSADVVLDIGTGTGAVALAVAPDADRVIGRDISREMLQQAREKASNASLENIEFGPGRFRDPNVEDPVDIVTSNYALHHLADADKREAIGTIAQLEPRRFVLGDVMLFEESAPDEPAFDPTVDDPAMVGVLADILTDCGFTITQVFRVTNQAGVIVATRGQSA